MYILKIIELTKNNIANYENLFFFPAHKQLLVSNIETVIAYAVMENNKPLLLIAGDHLGHIFTMRLFGNLFLPTLVDEVLNKIELDYKNQGISSIRIDYECPPVFEQEMEDAIQKRSGNPPVKHLDLFIGERKNLENDRWLSRDFLGNSTYTLKKWSELSSSQMEQLKLQTNGLINTNFYPFNDEKRILKDFSFIILSDTIAIGWLITERVARNMVYVKMVYTFPGYSERKSGLTLMNHFLNQLSTKDEIQYVMFAVEPENKNVTTLVKKRFQKGIVQQKAFYRSTWLIN